VQFGDPTTRDMTKQATWGTSSSGRAVGVDESSLAKRKFVRGTVGLGYRQGYNPRTADSYIIIIKGSNANMDGKYAVLGRVLTGMDVVDKLQVTTVIRHAYMMGERR
jgi:cyclophilin family peptidyl-prolyl cis-trans isomerase